MSSNRLVGKYRAFFSLSLRFVSSSPDFERELRRRLLLSGAVSVNGIFQAFTLICLSLLNRLRATSLSCGGAYLILAWLSLQLTVPLTRQLEFCP